MVASHTLYYQSFIQRKENPSTLFALVADVLIPLSFTWKRYALALLACVDVHHQPLVATLYIKES